MSLEWKRPLGTLKIHFSKSVLPYFLWGEIDDLIREKEESKFCYLNLYNSDKFSGITFVLYMDKEKFRKGIYKEELKRLFDKRSIYIKKASIGKRKNRIQFVVLGQILINPIEDKYSYTLRIEKGKMQMKRPLDYKFFENKYIRFYLLDKEKEKTIPSNLENLDIILRKDIGERYYFITKGNNVANKEFVSLDSFNTVFVEKIK